MRWVVVPFICIIAFLVFSNGLGVSTSQYSQWNGVKTLGTAARIDVFTQRGGVGPNVRSAAFALGEIVILYAYVTYNEWPEQQKDVTFYVYDSHSQLFTLRFPRTNESGIAKTTFTLPTTDPEYWIGDWTVTARATVASEVVDDALVFDVVLDLFEIPFSPYPVLGVFTACLVSVLIFKRLKTLKRWNT